MNNKIAKSKNYSYNCTTPDYKSKIKSLEGNFEKKNYTKEIGYFFIQDMKSPIYFTKGKNNSIFIATIKKVQSRIDKNVFEKGLKFQNRKPNDIPDNKFWNQRYYYYSKFDEGINMDYESWYSVTPEDLAYYCAKIAGSDSTCIDAFSGSGGNVIQFSKQCSKVYAVDIDPVKIEILKNNCSVYKCKENIEVYLSDYLKFNVDFKADYVFLSPPWGGVEYKKNKNYSLKNMVTPDIHEIIRKSISIGKNIMFYLPRLININELFEIVQEVTGDSFIFFDVHILESANKIKAILLLFGTKHCSISSTKIQQFLMSFTSNEEIPNDCVIITKNEYDEEPTMISCKGEEVLNEFFDTEYKNESHYVLYKIYNTIGYKKFFESLINYKEKNESKNRDTSNFVCYLPCKEKIPYLISYFFNEILTEKQKARLN